MWASETHDAGPGPEELSTGPGADQQAPGVSPRVFFRVSGLGFRVWLRLRIPLDKNVSSSLSDAGNPEHDSDDILPPWQRKY